VTAPLGIDVHAHFFPERFIRAIEEGGAPSGGSVDRGSPVGPAIVVKAARTPPLEARYYDLPRRVASMNRQGVAVQALSLTAPMVYWAQGELGPRLAREWNDGASAAHTAYPDRFVVCATLPMQDTAQALAELDRAAKLPGVRAVYMGTNVNGRNLSDPAFFPVFERCQALGLPVGLHPFNVNGPERLKDFYLTNLLGNPYDTGIAVAHLIFGGVLDRLPKLQVILPHAGGTFPLVVGCTFVGVPDNGMAQSQTKPTAIITIRFINPVARHCKPQPSLARRFKLNERQTSNEFPKKSLCALTEVVFNFGPALRDTNRD